MKAISSPAESGDTGTACLSDDDLAAVLFGKVEADALAGAEAHISRCSACVERLRMAVAATNATHNSKAPPHAQAALAPGTLLHETYEILRLIGRGGMGEVYEASHRRLPGRFAVKALGRAWAEDATALLRFRREAAVTSSLKHPHIVQVVDFCFADDGSPCLVMELIAGEDLGAILEREGALAPPRALALLGQIASALGAAHRRGVVHRDLKPQNVLVVPAEAGEPERAKLVDFGLSKPGTPSLVLTKETALLGTPRYMSPEQASGRSDEIDEKSDQFSLAAMAYEMLTGEVAFQGETLECLVYEVCHGTLRPASRVRSELPRALDGVLRRALEKKPAARYPSVDAFVRALDEAGRARRGFAKKLGRLGWPGYLALGALAAGLGFLGMQAYFRTTHVEKTPGLSEARGLGAPPTDEARVAKTSVDVETAARAGPSVATDAGAPRVTLPESRPKTKPKARLAPKRPPTSEIAAPSPPAKPSRAEGLFDSL